MIKYVSVVLSARVETFVEGIKNALGVFLGFGKGVENSGKSLLTKFSEIGNTVTGLKHTFDMLAGAARGLWDTFVQGAIDEERLGLTMKFLSGSAEMSSDIMERLDDWVVKTATDGKEADEAILDMAKALRSTDGAVDPDKLFRAMDLLKRLHLATGASVAEMSKVVGRAMTGDVEMLARTLGISKEQLAKLSPEFAKFMETAQGAQEAQLGEVTRLGGDAETVAGDALKALDEITSALGAGQESIAEYANSAGGEIESLQQLWNNFTDDVGKELLPIIQEALEKLITFITEHKEDIDKFVDAFGDIASGGFEKLMEWIDSGNAKKFFDDMSSFSSEQWKAFADAIANIDWKKISETISAIVEAGKIISDISELVGPGKAISNIKNGLANLTPGESGVPGQQISQGFSIPSLFESIFGKAQPPQPVEIKVSVDDDMKLRAVYDKATDEKIGEFVEATTGGNKQKSGEQQ